MKKILAALLVTLPLAALAQYEPAPPPPDDSAYGSRRSPWYIGFGIGGGNGNVSYTGGDYTFDEWHGGTNSPTNVFINFKIGATLAPGLLLGFDGSAVRSQLDEGGFVTALQINNYDAMLTWFPQEEGFFVRGGAGITRFVMEFDDGLSSFDDSVSGYNVLVGGGYAFWLGQAFNLTVNADYSIQTYGSNDYDLESSNFFALWVGFDWYSTVRRTVSSGPGAFAHRAPVFSAPTWTHCVRSPQRGRRLQGETAGLLESIQPFGSRTPQPTGGRAAKAARGG
jgi:hypothetical protein